MSLPIHKGSPEKETRPGSGRDSPALLLSPPPCPGRAHQLSSEACPHSPSPAISFCLPDSQQHHLSWGTSLQAWLLHLQCHHSPLPTTALDLLSPSILHPWGSKDLTLCWPLFVHHHPNDWMAMAVCSMRTLKVSDCTAHQESCWRVDCSTREAARSVQNMSEESTFGQEREKRCQCKSWKKTKTVWVLVAQIPWE